MAALSGDALLPDGADRAAPERAFSATPTARDKPIDGWRALAASLVIVSHASLYRFGAAGDGVLIHQARRLTSPLAEIGVQLFFVISGFIITSLLIRERATRGTTSIASFYARRVCRIMPPLLVYYLAVGMLAGLAYIEVRSASMVASASFTCNIGWVDCQWWVAHTWSLAVEEQFYLVWPLLFTLVAPSLRPSLLWGVLALGTVGALIQGPTFHANFTSFACIAAGALVASVPALCRAVQRATHGVPWLICIALLAIGPLTPAARLVTALLPALIVYTIFAGNRLAPVKAILVSRPLQLLGLASYSAYLWQQLFLAAPGMYAGAPPPLILLPVAVAASVWWVEKPFIRLGRSLSRRFERAPA